MGMANWEVVKSQTNAYVGLEIGTPIIVGAGSLEINNELVNNLAQSMTLRLSSAFSRGFTKGRIRTLLQISYGIQTHTASNLSIGGAPWIVTSASRGLPTVAVSSRARMAGWDLAANNISVTIVTSTPQKFEVSQTLATDAAGETVTITFGSQAQFLIGMLAMMNQADVRAVAGKCYVAGILIGDPAGSAEWVIGKFTNGIGAFATLTILAKKEVFLLQSEETVGLEFTWLNNTVEFPAGVGMALKRGTALDFSDLVPILGVSDISSPLTTSIGEGLIYVQFDTNAVTQTATFDNTRIEQLT